MLKLLASGLIVAASSGLGFAVADGYRHRPRQLRQLQFALTVLGSEIRFRQTPLPQGLQAVASAVGGPVGQLFADLAAVLARAQGRSVSWARART
ncbi:MAG: stage III sporulation protein AB, partial [Firmicutes bacterium]|nr:stage III sporulation protein AB [Bacillota bacterium]